MKLENKEQVIIEINKMIKVSNHNDNGYFLIVSNDIADILKLSKIQFDSTYYNDYIEIVREFIICPNQTMFLIPKYSRDETFKYRFLYIN